MNPKRVRIWCTFDIDVGHYEQAEDVETLRTEKRKRRKVIADKEK
ncbi:hypothetical protein [Sphingobacterium olei]|nr:hypothetical protein [Sphingobacterium olei]